MQISIDTRKKLAVLRVLGSRSIPNSEYLCVVKRAIFANKGYKPYLDVKVEVDLDRIPW